MRRLLLVVLTLMCACTTSGSSAPSGAPTRSPPTQTQLQPSETVIRRWIVRSRTDVLSRLASVGYPQALVLRIGRPIRIEAWSDAGRWRAKTVYRVRGGQVSLVQAEDAGSLPTGGTSVVFRRREATRVGHAIYWFERGYQLAADPATHANTNELEWRQTVG